MQLEAVTQRHRGCTPRGGLPPHPTPPAQLLHIYARLEQLVGRVGKQAGHRGSRVAAPLVTRVQAAPRTAAATPRALAMAATQPHAARVANGGSQRRALPVLWGVGQREEVDGA